MTEYRSRAGLRVPENLPKLKKHPSEAREIPYGTPVAPLARWLLFLQGNEVTQRLRSHAHLKSKI